MENNLLVSLRKYRPRENRDPLENFITEAFAWILNSYPDFGKFFLKRITEGLDDCSIEVRQKPEWSTQENFDGKYPDMFCELDETAFIFEHKASSSLHPNQLQNYRDYAENHFTKYHLILITGGAYLHDQNPDLALCWHNVYEWLKSWLNKQPASAADNLFILHDFLELLKTEGMGPPATISHEAILSYSSARHLKENVSALIGRVEKSVKWENLVKEDYEKNIPNNRCSLYAEHYGRIGINLLGGAAWDSWCPGIFVGFVIDYEDYNVKPLIPPSPDCSIIIDFWEEHHDTYVKHKLYHAMLEELENRVSILNKELASRMPDPDIGWDFHNHLKADDDPKNLWHPIHIRMPMLELFRGTCTSEEQDERFIEKVSEVLLIIKDCKPFWELRSVLKG